MKIELTDEMFKELEKQYEDDRLEKITFYKSDKFNRILKEIKEKDISFSTEDLAYNLSKIQSLFSEKYSKVELNQFIEIIKSNSIIENGDYKEIEDEEYDDNKEMISQLGIKVISIYGQGAITFIEKL